MLITSAERQSQRKDKSILQTNTVTANGVDFTYLTQGKVQGEGPLVLCIHGFPDTAYSYTNLIDRLSEQGYRAVAPFNRGYAPTSIPDDGRYSVIDIARDILSLIDALGENSAYVVGHDWGALANYAACRLAPEKIDKAVTAAVPHPRSLKVTAAQLRKSWYVFFFQLRLIAEWRVEKNNLAFIDRLWRDWSPGLSMDDAVPLIAEVKQSLSKRENLRAALGYYRAFFNPTNLRALQSLINKPIDVPTLTIAGEQDGCIGVENFYSMKQGFSQGFELKVMPGAGHFMQNERPDEFADLVCEFLNKKR